MMARTVRMKPATAPSENVEPSPSDSSISIWIGTSNREDQTTYTIGVYFGEEDDERNWSGCPELEKYNADDAYVWAATRAIERLENDATRVVIYTECSTLGEAKEGDALREQLHARIKQRSGITQFQHALPSASLKLQKATELAKAANAKDKAVDSLKVEAAAAAAAGIIMDELMEVDGDAAAEEATASTGSAGDGIDKAKDADMTPAVSWRPVFGLRNILEILKAPFVRGTRSI
ncbi:hypothetical protein BX666DRAFT_666712 [Dichotomocladium elegans]|nr:hypothetical protein BX666DRAFT_666712 [Dichotomocladium elegans]